MADRKRFEGRVALVTGGRTGIGRAAARRLLSEDSEFECIQADFSQPGAAEMVINEVIQRTGRLDILINNAGMMTESGIESMSVSDWEKNISVNLTTPFLLIRAALPHLRKTGGCIVNTGSIEGISPNPMHAAYSATKAGLHGLTRSVAVDHGHEGIRCNAVAPGWIDTELNINMIDNLPNADTFKDDIKKIHPIRRTGTPEEAAPLICFLASDDASFITGQVYTVDGGRMTQLSMP